ncbi:MAG: SusC/RagA family TonB-linked outer membrane protein, partial [Tannerella sp.]|nr:SusC/RagA family TonB-linked outer membrane protein [Tannerella sp.]
MRITVLLLFVTVLQSGANSLYSQSARVSLNMRNVTVEDVLHSIEGESEFYFLYNTKLVDVDRKVSVNVRSQTIENVLNKLFDGTDVAYKVEDRQIILSRKAFIENERLQGKKRITGVVMDDAGEPVAGAGIIEQGTSNGVISDIDGRFSMDVAEKATIRISYVGYLTQTVTIDNQTSLTVVMNEDTQALDEIVVVGYGLQKKVSVTGAVGSIRNEHINRMANSTTAAMQGVSPGLTILDKGGAPGRANTTLRIRGITTINNSDALLLVDGIEQRISDINPDDIENISILKDASTTAIYGSRAANGVVLMTTRRGKEGGVKIDLNTYWGVQRVTNRPEHMESAAYMRQQNYAFKNAGQNPRYSETFIQEWIDNHKKDPLTYREANQWQDVVYGNALQHNYSLNVSGGNEKARGLMALRYYGQDGVISNFNSDIKEIRVNTDFKPFAFVRLSADANFRTRYSLEPVGAYDYDVNGGGIFYSMYHATQFVVPRYPDGSYGLGNKNANPLLLAEKAGDNKEWNNLFIANLKAEVDICDGLRFITQYAQRYAYNKTVSFTNAYTVDDNNFLDWGATAREEAYNPDPARVRRRAITRNSMDDYRQ